MNSPYRTSTRKPPNASRCSCAHHESPYGSSPRGSHESCSMGSGMLVSCPADSPCKSGSRCPPRRHCARGPAGASPEAPVLWGPTQCKAGQSSTRLQAAAGYWSTNFGGRVLACGRGSGRVSSKRIECATSRAIVADKDDRAVRGELDRRGRRLCLSARCLFSSSAASISE